jgi:NAD(P)-dependent dehydrogenase (short-subunit alcohol dehydrogenase family)
MASEPIAVITGGAGALGSALAELLVTRSYKVALFDTEASKTRADDVAARLGKDRAIALAGDFGLATAWQGALDATKRAFGGLPTHAALVAGGWDGGAPLHAANDDDDAYERMTRLNVDTTYRALRALLPGMVQQKHGSVVVVGSRAIERPWTSAGAATYAASKAAAVTMAQAVAAEVLHDGVRVNAILPSTMDTKANRAAMPDADPSKWVALSSAAAVIAFLFSDDARDVTGAAIPVYGRV